MSFIRSRIGGQFLDFNFTKEIHGYNGNVDIVINGDGDDQGDIYLSNVKLGDEFRELVYARKW